MSFNYHGRDRDGLVWEQEITRYYFVSGEEVQTRHQHGVRPALVVGTRLKITKREAHQFFKRGYYEFHTVDWNEQKMRYDRVSIPVRNGYIGKDIEKRELREYACTPDEVAPRKRGRKDVAPPSSGAPVISLPTPAAPPEESLDTTPAI